MEKTQWYIGAPNGVVVCVDQVKERQPEGEFYHGYSEEAVRFTNLDQLLFELEGLFNALNFPQPTTNERSFQRVKLGGREQSKRVKIVKDTELLRKHGELGTFIIRVQHRQNSSWQGRITWMDQDKTVYFRSIWEMIKLVESALDTVSNQEGEIEEPSWGG